MVYFSPNYIEFFPRFLKADLDPNKNVSEHDKKKKNSQQRWKVFCFFYLKTYKKKNIEKEKGCGWGCSCRRARRNERGGSQRKKGMSSWRQSATKAEEKLDYFHSETFKECRNTRETVAAGAERGRGHTRSSTRTRARARTAERLENPAGRRDLGLLPPGSLGGVDGRRQTRGGVNRQGY